MKVIKINSLDELNQLWRICQEKLLIYRGQFCTTWPLYPSVYRKSHISELNLKYLETIKFNSLDHHLLINFKMILENESGYSNLIKNFKKVEPDLFIWAYVQHYSQFGTPYLDWTYSFPIAILFAIFKDINDIKRYDFKQIDPKFNHNVSLFTLSQDIFQMTSKATCYDYKSTNPTNERFAAQKGLLICPIDHYFLENSTFSDLLIKYEIPHGVASEFLTDIANKNCAIENELVSAINSLANGDTFDTEDTILKFLNETRECLDHLVKKGASYNEIRDELNVLSLIEQTSGFNKGMLICSGVLLKPTLTD